MSEIGARPRASAGTGTRHGCSRTADAPGAWRVTAATPALVARVTGGVAWPLEGFTLTAAYLGGSALEEVLPVG